ncbi:hypothetical protein [Pseudaminobacter salicylatoxidans]|uniref:hypothetical protein n=1 Tax=Pseudaminobacter salicylatoxidans TaxID=93369 RepID=UPI0011B218C9|nr:hypothetical protein [Pseudaminobacter salicylatoxidans]
MTESVIECNERSFTTPADRPCRVVGNQSDGAILAGIKIAIETNVPVNRWRELGKERIVSTLSSGSGRRDHSPKRASREGPFRVPRIG